MDVVATRAQGMRGQAFIVFETIQTATSALRGLTGFTFYGKPLVISYATGKSRAVLKKELGTDAVMQLQLDGALPLAQSAGSVTVSQSRKRTGRSSTHTSDDGAQDSDSSDDEGQPGPQPKRPKIDESASIPASDQATLLCTNLPEEITQDMLSALFQQFDGLSAITLSKQDADTGSTALISFRSQTQAKAAKDGLHGFRLTPTHVLELTLT